MASAGREQFRTRNILDCDQSKLLSISYKKLKA